jgi:hypothetical protein
MRYMGGQGSKSSNDRLAPKADIGARQKKIYFVRKYLVARIKKISITRLVDGV